MLISEKLQAALNQQIGNEFGANMEYLQIASYFEADDMLKLASIFFDQADEERFHAMKLLHYVLDAGGTVAIPALPQPRIKYDSPVDAVQTALTWEETVTKQINNLVSIAADEKDYISQEFLKWFVNEQLEEIAKMSSILNILKRAGDNILIAEGYIADTLTQMESVEGGSAAA